MYCLNHKGGSPKWLPGVISSVQGPVTVLVKLEDGKESPLTTLRVEIMMPQMVERRRSCLRSKM